MSSVAQTIALIASAVDRMGAPAFSRASDIPYTTLLDWRRCGYRPDVVNTFEKLAVAAERAEAAKVKPDNAAPQKPRRKTAA